MTGPRRVPHLRRGQPLIALGLLLTAWVGARAVLHDGSAETVRQPEVAARPAVRAPVAPIRAVQAKAAAERPVLLPRPAPARPFVAAPQAPPDFERLRLAEEHQLLWQAAVAPQPEAMEQPEQPQRLSDEAG